MLVWSPGQHMPKFGKHASDAEHTSQLEMMTTCWASGEVSQVELARGV